MAAASQEARLNGRPITKPAAIETNTRTRRLLTEHVKVIPLGPCFGVLAIA